MRPCALERCGGEDREQEVPGDAVARRADEDERGGRLVGEEQRGEERERRRRDEGSDERERIERDDAAAHVEVAAAAGTVARLEHRRLPQELRRERREPRLPAGVVAPVVEREILVEAHLQALVWMQPLPRAEPDAVRLLRRQPPRIRRAWGMPADV